MLKALTVMLTLCGSVSAETYHLDASKGAVVKHAHRCASPKAVKRLTDLVAKNPNVIIGHEQMTTAFDDKDADADLVLEDDHYHWGWWHAADNLTVIFYVRPRLDDPCRDAHKCLMRAELKVTIIQRYDGASCYEQWSGTGEQI